MRPIRSGGTLCQGRHGGGGSASVSRLVADGGWLRSTEPAVDRSRTCEVLGDLLAFMLEDVESTPGRRPGRVFEADARSLPLADGSVQAVITSPPYPNRHDYTRVFGVELDLLFGLGAGVKQLRYKAMRSHPEAALGAGQLTGNLTARLPGFRRRWRRSWTITAILELPAC